MYSREKVGYPMFLPKFIFRELTDISAEFLRNQGIELLLMDFDNTMLPYTTDVPSQELFAWIRSMESAGIRLCIVSNSKRSRVPEFSRKYKVPCVTHAKKPGRGGILRAVGTLDKKQVAMVGDQIFTDVLGANRAGVLSLLVKPIHNHNIWLKLRHVAEQPFILLSEKRRIT